MKRIFLIIFFIVGCVPTIADVENESQEYVPPDVSPRIDVVAAAGVVSRHLKGVDARVPHYIDRMVLIAGEKRGERFWVVWVAKPKTGYQIYQVDMHGNIRDAEVRWIKKAK